MYGVQDGARDLNTALWSGAGWTVHGEHDANTEDANHRNFDIVFETHPANAGQAWLVWGTQSGADRAVYRRWTGAAWTPNPPAVGTSIAGADDTALVQLAAHSVTGALFLGIYEDFDSASRDISETHQVNGVQAWSGYVDIWTGPTSNDPVLERVSIAVERYVPNILWREVVQ
jgi:hypothetical protein